MATSLRKRDVVIVGLGAAGGVAALPLSRAGLDVLALEAGGRFSTRDFPSDEIRNDLRNWMGRAKVNNEVPTHRLTSADTAGPALIAIRMMNGVGGTSIHYTMQSWRLLPWNFKSRSETIARYGEGAIPAGSTVADWPLTYEDLEPYYDKVEYEIGVSGKAGNVKGKVDARGNIFEGPRRREYPMPPLRRSGWTELMSDAAGTMGWHPFPGPAAINSVEYEGRSACTYHGFCTSNGCHVNAKGSTFLNAIPDAERSGNLTIVTRARVTKIVTNADGRVSGVLYLKGGKRYFQPADVVLLTTYTYENVRLLLLSRSKAYPNGLSNNAGQVGKHYMSHVYTGISGLFPGRRLNRFSGTGSQFVAVDDLDSDNFDHSGLGFIGGGSLQASMEVKPIAMGRASPPSVPRWGSAWKAWLKDNANSVGDAFAQMEMLPYEDNYLDLDPTTRDPQGFPVIRATFDLKQDEQRRAAYLNENMTDWLKAAGATETWTGFPPIAIGVNSHAYGGTRMGDDADTSVVDSFCMSHEAPNLGVIGGSCFPTTSGRNPTETVEALAWRTGVHVVKNWKTIAA
jgi:gluconate 2-dehydrogenase alpha chain